MSNEKIDTRMVGPQLPDRTAIGKPDISDNEREYGQVGSEIVEGGRVMIAAIKLPDKGIIPEGLKRKVCKRVDELRKRKNVTIRSLSKQLDAHVAIVSQVLRREYKHPDDDVIRKLNSWCESTVRRIAALRQEGLCDTTVVKLERAACDFAKSQSCIVLCVGPSGIGKSVAAKAYCAEDLNSIYVRLRSTHSSPTTFLKLIAEACRVPAEGGKAKIMDAVVEKLKGSHRLLVLDEWHRAERPLYECVRDLHDVAEIPIVLIGTEEVQKRVVEARVRKGTAWSDQFCSRIGWVLDLARLRGSQGEPRPLFTEAEIREVFRSDQIRISKDGIAFLQALACSVGLGCLRMAQRCFEMAAKLARRRGGEVTAKELRKAFIHQAVPDGLDDSALLMRVEETTREIRALAAG